MKCGECRFNLPCWTRHLGFDSERRQNMSLCPLCGHLTLHFMKTPVAFLEESEEELILVSHGEWVESGLPSSTDTLTVHNERHFIFYCEHRFLNKNIEATWNAYYTTKGVSGTDWYNLESYGVHHFTVQEGYDVEGKVEVRPCYPCAGHDLKRVNAKIVELDKLESGS